MSANRWCSHCRSEQPIEWREDGGHHPNQETARCPRCGAIWGVRARRPVPADPRASESTQPVGRASEGRATPV